MSTVAGPSIATGSADGPLDMLLKERLEVYRRSKTLAETEGNSSKVRRYGRICKQFEDALKLHARGKPVPLDELPTPPGFPPLGGPPPPPSPIPEAPAPVKADEEPSPEEKPTPSSSKTMPTPPPRQNSGFFIMFF